MRLSITFITLALTALTYALPMITEDEGPPGVQQGKSELDNRAPAAALDSSALNLRELVPELKERGKPSKPIAGGGGGTKKIAASPLMSSSIGSQVESSG